MVELYWTCFKYNVYYSCYNSTAIVGLLQLLELYHNCIGNLHNCTVTEELYCNCYNRPYSRRGHDGQKERLGLQIYRKFAHQYINCDVTSLLLQVPVT